MKEKFEGIDAGIDTIEYVEVTHGEVAIGIKDVTSPACPNTIPVEITLSRTAVARIARQMGMWVLLHECT